MLMPIANSLIKVFIQDIFYFYLILYEEKQYWEGDNKWQERPRRQKGVMECVETWGTHILSGEIPHGFAQHINVT